MMKLYLNGDLVGSLPVQGTVTTTGDSMTLSGDEVMDGLLDEFTLYRRALSTDEIKAIFQAGGMGKCRP
jgi:hypothetical protein